MKSINPSTNLEDKTSGNTIWNPQTKRFVQILSRVITVIFIAALIWVIYHAIVNGNPLPAWAWLGIVAIFAVVIGLVVMAVVYRGVSREVGPFDFRPSSYVTGELKTESRHVEASGTSSLKTNLKMTEGFMQLTGGAEDVMAADFIYDDADWQQPLVNYAVNDAGEGSLTVEQKATGRPAMRQGRCEWVIHLNRDLPTDLNVRFGAGKANLKLGSLMLTRLHVESGVGELALDLSGVWRHNMQAIIKAGIGDISLRLPQNVGLRIQSAVGFGSVHPQDLTWDGVAYTNAFYGQSPVTLDISIEGGMGEISLEQSD